MAERRLRGRAASSGIALGPLHLLPEAEAVLVAAVGDAASEHRRLDTAIAAACADLDALMASVGEDGAEILAFQREMLDDPALVEEARRAIDAGAAALAGWRQALDAQIEGFLADEDDYFRARAADLADLRSRVADRLAGRAAIDDGAPAGAVLCGRDLVPSWFLAANWSRLGGIALAHGSAQSHVAMLARARGVPMVVDLGEVPAPSGDVILDAEDGVLVVDPTPATRAAFAVRRADLDHAAARAAAHLGEPAFLPNGERIQCLLNIDDPASVDPHLLDAADGVGLWRTEFLFLHRAALPTEDEQCAAYTALLDRLGGRPVIVRTLDVGGDKPLAGVSLSRESNPFLGLRGLRLCLDRPALFRPQIRALLRAAPRRALEVMLPMVTRPGELAEARALFRACLDELQAEGVEAAMPPLGIMVETPASAIRIADFDAAFVSIGSNDLTQYTMAASRDAGGRVAALADPLDAAVLDLIAGVVRHGRAVGLEVSLCGDMAADPVAVDRLLDLGLRRLSVGPSGLARLKLAVHDHGR